MIIGSMSILFLCIIDKYTQINLSINKKIITFLLLFSIPLFYVQTLIIFDKLYEVNVTSSLESSLLNLEIKDGFIGEINEDKYIIYQENENLILNKNELIFKYNEKDYSFEKLTIMSNQQIKFSSIINEFLCKDYLIYEPIVNKNNELLKEETNIYVLQKDDKLRIKGED